MHARYASLVPRWIHPHLCGITILPIRSMQAVYHSVDTGSLQDEGVGIEVIRNLSQRLL